MPQPFNATAKIRWGYVIDGQSHRVSAYVKGLTLQGSQWFINSRTTDANDQLWTDAAEGLAAAYAHVLGTTTVGSVARLFQLINGVWVQRDASSPAMTPSGNSYVKASEICMTLQTTTFDKVKVFVLEGEESPQLKISSPTGGGTQMDLFCAEYTSSHVHAHAPYVWQVGRDNQYLAVNPFVSATVTLNRKLRRARGYA